MTLYLAQVELDWPKVLQGSEHLRNGLDPGYHLHAWSAGVFGPAALQPFRWLDRRGTLLAYANAPENELLEHADRYALPTAREAIRSLKTKALPTSWQSGTRVGFSVRVAPTVRLASAVPGRAAKGSEVDAYSAARWRGEEPDRDEVYRSWLSGQLERHGDATLESLRFESRQLSRLLRRKQQGNRPAKTLTLPDVTCTGVLTVGDGERFASLLQRGVGRHRAFGFGMLLLRPPPC